MSKPDTQTSSQLDGEQNTQSTADIAALQAEIEHLKVELEQEKNARLLARADFENYRKQKDIEKAKFGAITNMQLVTQILEVIDDIQLALQDEGLTKDRAEEMLKISQDKLVTAVMIAGLEKIEAKVGDPYDAGKMEAITTSKVETEDQHNKVVALISSGYQYSNSGDILKTAKVVVGKYTPEVK